MPGPGTMSADQRLRNTGVEYILAVSFPPFQIVLSGLSKHRLHIVSIAWTFGSVYGQTWRY